MFEQNLKSAEEVACTLVYGDGWSLLRTNKQQVCYIVVTMKADTASILNTINCLDIILNEFV